MKFILLLLALTLTAVLCDQDKKEVTFHETHYGQNNENSEANYYFITIPQGLDPDFVIFQAKGITAESEPQMFISTDIQKWPNSAETSEFHTNPSSQSLIYLSKKDIGNSQTFTIGVNCKRQCSFKFTAFVQHENIKMGMNDERFVYIEEEDAPQYMNIDIERGDFKTFIAEYELVNPFQVKSTFDAYFVTRGQEKPGKDRYDSKGIGWGHGNGQGLIGYQDDEICSSCQLKSALYGKKGTLVRVQTYSYGHVRELESFEIINDFSYTSQEKLYILEIDEEKYSIDYSKQSLQFALVLFQGEADLYVSLNNCPRTGQDFDYSSSNIGDDRIFIENNKKKGVTKFCIKVATTVSSLYSLNIYPLESSKVILPWDYPETAVVNKEEILNYKIQVDSSADIKLMVQLMANTGQVQLLVMECQTDIANCQITKEDVAKRQHVSEIQYTDENLKYQKIDIEAQSSKCKSSKSHGMFDFCYYVVGVYGIKDNSKFTLQVSHDSYHTVLTENRAQISFVEQGQYNYFKFNIKNYKEIAFINISVTTLHGSVTMLTSDVVQHPDVSSNTKNSFWNYIQYKEGEFKEGSLFIGILGDDQYSEYTITVSLVLKDHEDNQSYVKLTNGIPNSIYFSGPRDKAYIKFQSDSDQDVELFVKRVYGKFRFYLATSPNLLPSSISEDEYTDGWSSHHKQIIIKSDDPKKSTNGQYYGVIFAEPITGLTTHYVCEVTFSNNDIRVLRLSDMTNQFIGAGEVHRYTFQIYSGYDDYIFTRYFSIFDQSDISVYGIIQSSFDHFGTEKGHDFELKEFEQTLITKEIIEKKCPFLTNGTKTQSICYILINVKAGNQDTEYNILVDKSNSPLQIHPDNSLNIALFYNKEAQVFQKKIYMQIDTYVEQIFIDLTKIVISPTMSYDIYRSDEFMQGNWSWPDADQKQDIEQSEQVGHIHQYKINQDMLSKKGCQVNHDQDRIPCVLVMTVSISKDVSNVMNQSKNDDFIEVGISVNTGVRQLRQGQQVQGNVDENFTDYYSFFIFDESIKGIIIDTTIYNDGQLEVFAQQNDAGVPSISEDLNIYKAFGTDHSLVIEAEKGKSMVGQYVVAIHGLKRTSVYGVSFRNYNEKYNFQHVKSGTPHQFSVQGGHETFLVYHSKKVNDMYFGFRAIFTEISGTVNVSAMPVDLYRDDLIDYIVKEKVYEYKSKTTSHLNMLEITSDDLKQKCNKVAKCGIIFRVYSPNYASQSVLIEDPNNLIVHLPIHLQQSNYLEAGQTKLLYLMSDTDLQLTTMLFSGSLYLDIGQGESQKHSYLDKVMRSNTQLIPAVQYSQRIVKIKAIKNSVFTVQATPTHDDRLLALGVPHQFKLTPGMRRAAFKVNTNPIQNNKHLEFAIQSQPFKYSIKQPPNQLSVDFMFVGKLGSYHLKTVENHVYEGNYLYIIDQPTEKGYIQINIQIQNSLQNMLFITVSEQGKSQLMVSNIERKGFGISKGTHMIYELLIPKKNSLLLSTSTCQGNIAIIANDDYKSIQQGLGNIKPDSIWKSPEQEYLSFKSEEETRSVFLNVEILNPNTVYSITPFLINDKHLGTPLSYIQRQNYDEKIKMKYVAKDKRLRFMSEALWGDFKEMQQAGWKVLEYNYKFIFSDNEPYLEEVALCNNKFSSNLVSNEFFYHIQEKTYDNINEEFPEKYRIAFSLYKEDIPEWTGDTFDKELYIKIVGTVHLQHEQMVQQFKFPYETIKIDTSNAFFHPHRLSAGIISIIVISVLAVLGAGIMLYRRWKLKRENSDVSHDYGNLETKISYVDLSNR